MQQSCAVCQEMERFRGVAHDMMREFRGQSFHHRDRARWDLLDLPARIG